LPFELSGMAAKLFFTTAAAASSADVVSGSGVSGADVVSATDTAMGLIDRIKNIHLDTGDIIILALIIFALIMLGLELLRSNFVLSVNRKLIVMDSLPKNFDGTRVAVISDMHSMRYGEHNEELAKRIKREEPDYIMFVGDMGDAAKMDVNAFYDFLESIGEEIPIILVPGCDDLRLGSGSVHKNFAREVERAGAVILNNTCAEMVSGDQKLYIYGFCQPLSKKEDVPATKWNLGEVSDKDVPALLGACPGDAPVILLAHDPAPFPSYRQWGASLVLSGGCHGGIVRLPFIGGLLSPIGGAMPKYSAGHYELGGSQMYVTRGLSSSGGVRLFNSPEIAILTLVCPGSKIIPAAAEKINYTAIAGRQLRSVGEWFRSEGRSLKDLLDERLTQVRDFFSSLFGKKRSRFAVAADVQKRRSTYIAPKGRKKKPTRPKNEDEE